MDRDLRTTRVSLRMAWLIVMTSVPRAVVVSEAKSAQYTRWTATPPSAASVTGDAGRISTGTSSQEDVSDTHQREIAIHATSGHFFASKSQQQPAKKRRREAKERDTLRSFRAPPHLPCIKCSSAKQRSSLTISRSEGNSAKSLPAAASAVLISRRQRTLRGVGPDPPASAPAPAAPAPPPPPLLTSCEHRKPNTFTTHGKPQPPASAAAVAAAPPAPPLVLARRLWFLTEEVFLVEPVSSGRGRRWLKSSLPGTPVDSAASTATLGSPISCCSSCCC